MWLDRKSSIHDVFNGKTSSNWGNSNKCPLCILNLANWTITSFKNSTSSSLSLIIYFHGQSIYRSYVKNNRRVPHKWLKCKVNVIYMEHIMGYKLNSNTPFRRSGISSVIGADLRSPRDFVTTWMILGYSWVS